MHKWMLMFTSYDFSGKISLLKGHSQITWILFVFRYVSLFCTSFIYIIGSSGHSAQKKLFVILCLTLSAVILSNLYVRSKGVRTNILLLLLIETAGNTLLIIPSGGMESPYVWYCINTILIAALELDIIYSWIILFTYTFAATCISGIVLTNERHDFLKLIYRDSNFILSLILITAAVRLVAKYAKDLENEGNQLLKLNLQLNEANKKIRKSMDYMMELYQTIQLLSIQSDKAGLFKSITHYARKIIMTDTALFCSLSKDKNEIFIEADWDYLKTKEEMEFIVPEAMKNCPDRDLPIEAEIEGRSYVLVFVKSDYMAYGVLGVEATGVPDGLSRQEMREQLRILAGISAIILQKLELERENEKLAIAEEQNRIAGEIHDSVLQKLFGVSCGLFTLMRNHMNLRQDKIQKELKTLKDSTNNIMKDLRNTIYGLSWKKGGNNGFIADLRGRIKELEDLSNAHIEFTMNDDRGVLSTLHKKAIYRFICEGIGNAVRHGKATNIDILLNVCPAEVALTISDNGTGFDPERVKPHKGEGMGISNLYQLTAAFFGNISLDSAIGRGTRIQIVLPSNIQHFREEVV